MKKIIAAMLAVVLAGSCLYGCARNQKNESSDDVPTLTWYIPSGTQKDAPLVEEKLCEILAPKIGAKLNMKFIDGGAFGERLSMMMASGNDFDLTFAGFCNPYGKAVSLNGFKELSAYIDKTPELKKAIPDYGWQSVTTGRGIYAVPNLQIYANWNCPVLRDQYVKKYNFDVSAVKQINDLEPFLKSVKENEPNLYPFEAGYGVDFWAGLDAEAVSHDIGLLYINLNDPECKIYKVYEKPEWIAGICKLREWYEKGYIRQDVASASGTTGTSKKYAVMFGTNKPGLKALFASQNNGENIDIIPLGEPVMSMSTSLNTLTAVGANSKYPELAVKLIEQVNINKDVHRLLTHGIEGVHYEKIDDIHIKLLEKDGYNLTGSGWMIGNDFNSYLVEGQDADTWEKTAELNQTALKSPLLGFSLDTSNIINEMSNITTINSEFSGLLNGSVADVDGTLKTFVNKLDNAGIDKVREEMQRQINDFLSKKN